MPLSHKTTNTHTESFKRGKRVQIHNNTADRVVAIRLLLQNQSLCYPPKFSSKTRDSNEPLTNPLVFETVPHEFSFVSDCEAWKKEVTSIVGCNEHVDYYPSLIKSGLLPLVHKKFYWKPNFQSWLLV